MSKRVILQQVLIILATLEKENDIWAKAEQNLTKLKQNEPRNFQDVYDEIEELTYRMGNLGIDERES